jgi:hypothetical protein
VCPAAARFALAAGYPLAAPSGQGARPRARSAGFQPAATLASCRPALARTCRLERVPIPPPGAARRVYRYGKWRACLALHISRERQHEVRDPDAVTAKTNRRAYLAQTGCAALTWVEGTARVGVAHESASRRVQPRLQQDERWVSRPSGDDDAVRDVVGVCVLSMRSPMTGVEKRKDKGCESKAQGLSSRMTGVVLADDKGCSRE